MTRNEPPLPRFFRYPACPESLQINKHLRGRSLPFLCQNNSALSPKKLTDVISLFSSLTFLAESLVGMTSLRASKLLEGRQISHGLLCDNLFILHPNAVYIFLLLDNCGELLLKQTTFGLLGFFSCLFKNKQTKQKSKTENTLGGPLFHHFHLILKTGKTIKLIV